MPEALRLSFVITYVIILVEIDRNGLEDKSKKKYLRRLSYIGGYAKRYKLKK